MAVVIETTLGDITVDLYLDQRPVTCLNFLKLCKMKYYNYNLFHTIRSDFIAQTGDPTGGGSGGESIWGILEGPQKRFFSGEKMPKIRHTGAGLLSMVCTNDMMVGSQFFFTLAPDLDSLDGTHCVIGEVTEGHEVLTKLNEVICDESNRPYRDVRITHTVVLEDPFNDPPGLRAPSRSPSPSAERLKGGRIAPDEDIDETQGKSVAEVQEMIEEKEAKARATILEIVGDLPDADIAPPENVLFVCKLNPVTSDDDLEIIFSRFGKIVSCEVIRDKKSGNSLQYAFIEFENKKSCEDAYFKMDNVLIDDRRIHVDFSQSVSKMRYLGKGRGVQYLNDEVIKNPEITKRSTDNRDTRRERNDDTSRKENSDNRRYDKESRHSRYDRSEGRHDRSENRNDRGENRHDRADNRQNKTEIRNDRGENRHDRGENRHDRGDNRQDRGENRNDRGENRHDRGENRHDRGDNRQDRGENRNDRGENRQDRGENRQDRGENRYEREKTNKRIYKSRSRSPLRRQSRERVTKNGEHDDYKKVESHKYDKDRHSDSYRRSSPDRRTKNNSDYSPQRHRDSVSHRGERRNHDRKLEKNDTNKKSYEEDTKSKNSKQKEYNDLDRHEKTKKTKQNHKNSEAETPSPVANSKKDKNSKKKNRSKNDSKKNGSKRKHKKSTSSDSDSSDSSSSSSDSSSSSESDGKKKSRDKRKKRKYSSSSSSDSSSSSSSDSSSDSSSSSSDSEPSKKRAKKVKSKSKNKSK